MKKTSVFALVVAMAMPAFATTDTTKMYGNTSIENADVADTTVLPADETAVAPVELSKIESESVNTTSTNPDIKFPHGMQLGLGISATGGLDGFIGYNNKNFDSFWWKRFGVRLGYATTKPMKSLINKGVDKYMGDGVEIGDHLTISDGQITAKHMFAMIDFYPFGDTWFLGGLRMSGGYYKGDLNVSADLTAENDNLVNPGTQFELGDTLYRYNGGDAKGLALAKWKFSGPYAGLGFDIGLFAGLKIYFDAGVVFTDETAKLDLQITDVAILEQSTNNGTTWSPIVLSDFETNKADALADAQKELDKIDYYPIVKLGFMYRF